MLNSYSNSNRDKEGYKMTEKELNSLYYVNIELEQIKQDIEDIKEQRRQLKLDASIGGMAYDGMPHSTEPGRPVENKVISYEKKRKELDDKLQDELEYQAERMLEYEIKKAIIEEFIYSITDAELRIIFKYRCIKLYSWDEIGRILHCDRRTASRKYYRYIDNLQK